MKYSHAKPIVEIIYRVSGQTKHKFQPWQRPSTDTALAEWIEEYFILLSEGYQPSGFDSPPIPHCCRIHSQGRVVAEWYLSPKPLAESHVTADAPLGREGIPEDVPSTTCSEDSGCPQVPSHTVSIPSAERYYGSLGVKNPSTPDPRLGLGQPVA